MRRAWQASEIHKLNLLCCVVAAGLAANLRHLSDPRTRAALLYLWRSFLGWFAP